MIKLKELENYLAELLDTASFDDYCVNGIQVEGKDEINSIVTGVSASSRLFRAVLERKADAVILHHGLFWKNSPHPMALKGILRERVKLLLDAEISLFGYHLPLDGHPELGNNVLIAQALGLEDITFCILAGMTMPLAAVGDLKMPVPFEEFERYANLTLETTGLGFNFGRKLLRRVFVVSGHGGGDYIDAVEAGADLLVTGSLQEDSVRACEELELSLYAAGHYNSEKWGVEALGEHLRDKFDLDVEFVDVPNPV